MDFAVALKMPLVGHMSTFPVSTSTDVNNLSRVGCQTALEAKWTGRKPTKPKRLCASVRSQALPSRRLWDLEMESEGHIVLAPLMLSTSAWSTAADCGDQVLACNLKAWVQCLIHTVLGRSYLDCFWASEVLRESLQICRMGEGSPAEHLHLPAQLSGVAWNASSRTPGHCVSYLGSVAGQDCAHRQRRSISTPSLPCTVPWMLLLVSEASNSAPFSRHFWTCLMRTKSYLYCCITFSPFFSSKLTSSYEDLNTQWCNYDLYQQHLQPQQKEDVCLFDKVCFSCIYHNQLCFLPPLYSSSLLTQPHLSYSVTLPVPGSRQINL